MRSSPSISLMIRSQRNRRIAHIAGLVNSVFPNEIWPKSKFAGQWECPGYLAAPTTISDVSPEGLDLDILFEVSLEDVEDIFDVRLGEHCHSNCFSQEFPPNHSHLNINPPLLLLVSILCPCHQCGPRQPHNWVLFSNILKSVNLRRACAPNVSHKYNPPPIHVPICNETTVKTNI